MTHRKTVFKQYSYDIGQVEIWKTVQPERFPGARRLKEATRFERAAMPATQQRVDANEAAIRQLASGERF